MLLSLPLALLLVPLTCSADQQFPLISPDHPGTEDSYGPDPKFARQNANHVFNALHSSMRQWGSSLKHNGISFFPATVPASTSLYHGTHNKERVTGMEWLAFEIEHAEVFARPFGPPKKGHGPGPPGGPPGKHRPPGGPPPGRGRNPSEEKPPSKSHSSSEDESRKGYLHVYKTTRELTKLLYIDGMSAGKTSMGTLDSTDLVLRNETERNIPVHGDWKRAEDLCTLGAEWGLEGFIRMEAGFELILCDFEDGLILESVRQTPSPQDYGEDNGILRFEYLRGVAARYQGITASRILVDYSSMVSAYFYPLNLTNPDASRSEQPRLVSSDEKGVLRVKTDLRRILQDSMSKRHAKIDWQGVVDMIISRYSDRLMFLKSKDVTQKQILSELQSLLGMFLDYPDPDTTTGENFCAVHYLQPVTPATSQDLLIHEALSTVTSRICKSLFEVRQLLLEAEKDKISAVEEAKIKVGNLTDYLDWTTWLECGKCDYDEVCYVAVWPWGRVQDHYNPGCLKYNETAGLRGYWEMDRPGPHDNSLDPEEL